jgi:chemotaxis protein histidine kinase CheA
MKRIGVKRVRISSIKAGGDVALLRKDPLVQDIQESLETTGGQPAEPIVVDKDNNIVAGRKRLAACLNAKVQFVDVVAFDGTPDELEQICIVENVRRRHMVGAELDEEIAKLVTLTMASVPHEEPEDAEDAEDEPEEPKRGRPKSAAGKAREIVAKKICSTPEAVRSAEKRAKQAAATKEAPKAPSVPTSPKAKIETLGMDVPESFIETTNNEHEQLTELYGDLVEIQKQITRISKTSGRTYTALSDAVHNAEAVCKREVPSHVCVWCKRHHEVMKTCLGCQGKGYLTVGEMAAIHDKKLQEQLLRKGPDAGVYVGGQFVPMKEL